MNNLSEYCTYALKCVLDQANIEADYSSNTLRVDGIELVLDATSERDFPAHGKHNFSIAVKTFLNGIELPIISGSVGVGENRTDAIQTAIVDWREVAGIALINGLLLRSRTTDFFAINGVTFFPGHVGIRGSVPDNWPSDLDEDLRQCLHPLLHKMIDSTIDTPHSLYIMLTREVNGNIDGECRFDRDVSTSILDALKKFPWPKSKNPYMFKQFYLLRSS